MQNDTEIESLQERFNELSETLADQFQALSDTEAKLRGRASQMYSRHVEMRQYKMYSLKEPIYPIFVEIISALKSIEELLSECEEFNEEANFISDDIHFELKSMHERLDSGIQKYANMYREGSADFKSAIRKAFAEQADLIEWFMPWIEFYEQCEDGWDESEVEQANVNVHGFFDNSRVLLFSPSRDPRELFLEAEKKYKCLEQEFYRWFDAINKFNDDLDKNIETCADKVLIAMEHCENFLEMRVFIAGLLDVLRSHEKYCNTLPDGEAKEILEQSKNALMDLIGKLAGNVNALHKFMRKLAADCEKDKDNQLTVLMCDFMRPWGDSKFSDEEALVQSVRVIWEADIEKALSPEFSRSSFGK